MEKKKRAKVGAEEGNGAQRPPNSPNEIEKVKVITNRKSKGFVFTRYELRVEVRHRERLGDGGRRYGRDDHEHNQCHQTHCNYADSRK